MKIYTIIIECSCLTETLWMETRLLLLCTQKKHKHNKTLRYLRTRRSFTFSFSLSKVSKQQHSLQEALRGNTPGPFSYKQGRQNQHKDGLFTVDTQLKASEVGAQAFVTQVSSETLRCAEAESSR